MNNPLVYYIFFKPFQVLSQFTSEGNKECLSDFIKDIPKDIYPVGRLDYDSEGLLLLSNDKKINQRLLHPKFEHSKTYLVQVEGLISSKAIEQLKSGVIISVNKSKYKTKPANAKIVFEPSLPERNPPIRFRKNIPTSWLELTITEGKNRQVRKMTAAVGFPTLRLVRIKIGAVDIGDMQIGELKPLGENDLKKLFIGNRKD